MGAGNWGRAATSPRFLARELLLVATGSFVGDGFCVEARKSATTGFWPFKQMCLILGFPTSPKKDQQPETEAVFLRALVSIRDTFAHATARADRIEKLKSHIPHIHFYELP